MVYSQECLCKIFIRISTQKAIREEHDKIFNKDDWHHEVNRRITEETASLSLEILLRN